MHGRPKLRTHYDQELGAQGIGNFFSGLLGGLPMTGVIVRSAANVEAGAPPAGPRFARRLDAAARGRCPWLLAYVPTASLAAVLVYTGIKLVNVPAMKDLAGFGRDQIPSVATLLLIVCTDLLTGSLLGWCCRGGTVSSLDVLRNAVRPRVARGNAECLATKFRGARRSGLPKPSLGLAKFPPQAHAILDVSGLEVIDHACLDCEDLGEAAPASGGAWRLTGRRSKRKGPGAGGCGYINRAALNPARCESKPAAGSRGSSRRWGAFGGCKKVRQAGCGAE